MDHLKTVLQKTNLRRHDIVVMTVRTHLDRRRRVRSGRRSDLLRLRKGAVQPRGRRRRERRQAGGTAGGAGRESLRRHGADRGQAEGFAAGDRRFRHAWNRKNWPAPSGWPGRACRNRGTRFRSRSSAPTGPPCTSTWARIRRGCGRRIVDRLHDLWLQLSEAEGVGSKLHHRDVVGLALKRLEKDFTGQDREKVLDDLQQDLHKH